MFPEPKNVGECAGKDESLVRRAGHAFAGSVHCAPTPLFPNEGKILQDLQ